MVLNQENTEKPTNSESTFQISTILCERKFQPSDTHDIKIARDRLKKLVKDYERISKKIHKAELSLKDEIKAIEAYRFQNDITVAEISIFKQNPKLIDSERHQCINIVIAKIGYKHAVQFEITKLQDQLSGITKQIQSTVGIIKGKPEDA